MTRRDVSHRDVWPLLALLVGCYDTPQPDCGFRCGDGSGCPDGYACASDGRCHLEGSDPGLVCATPDAARNSPRVISSFPEAGATIDPTATLRVEFDVSVDGVNASSYRVVVSENGGDVFGLVAYDPAAKIATWSAPGGLPAGESLVMALTSEIRDGAGTELTPTAIPFFTSVDVVSPQIDLVVPAQGATNVALDTEVTLRFTEQVTNVNAGTLAVSGATIAAVVYEAPQRRATITFQDPLAPATTYTVTASDAIVDASNNQLVPFTSQFTTVPALTRLAPPLFRRRARVR